MMNRQKLICLLLAVLFPFSFAQLAKIDFNASNKVTQAASSTSLDIQSHIGSYMPSISSIFSKGVEAISEGAVAIGGATKELGETVSTKVHDIRQDLATVFQDFKDKIDPTETTFEWLKRLFNQQTELLLQLFVDVFAKIETEHLNQFFSEAFAKFDLEQMKEQIISAIRELLWSLAYYLIGAYLIITYAPLLIKGLFMMCFQRITRDRSSGREQKVPKASVLPSELKADQFKVEDLHVTVDRVPYTASKCFLKFYLHYTIHHFNREDGNVIILITTFIEDSLKQSHTVTIPAAKFSISSVYKACSFREPVELAAEKVKIKVNILFQSNIRQTLSLCNGGFDITLKPLDSKQVQQSYKDSAVRFFIRTLYTLFNSPVLFGSNPEKVLLISEMSKKEFAKS